MADSLKVGMVGLDTSHVEMFTQLLNDPNDPDHVAGAKVVAAFPGGSQDFDMSYSRVPGFTEKLRDHFGVQILDFPEAVAESVDLLFITAVDGRVHREFFERTVTYKKPTYIDKPFATTVSDAQAILVLAEKHDVPVMSCSALRFVGPFVEALTDESLGKLVGIDTCGPMALQPTQPGLFWYGIHCVEMIVAAMGVGCRRVRVVANDDFDLVTAEWHDGRLATYRGMRRGHQLFNAMLHREQGFNFVDVQSDRKPFYAPLLAAIMHSLPQRRSAVPPEQILEVIRLIEAANESRGTGKTVELTSLSVM